VCKKPWMRQRMLLLCLPFLTLLSGCAELTGTAGKAPEKRIADVASKSVRAFACGLRQPSWVPQDTAETAQSVRIVNAQIDTACKGGKV